MSETHQVAIQLKDVSSGYYNQKVLEGITFQIQDPTIYVVLGPNGAGKTTLFRTIAGILHPFSGEIFINGIPAQQQAAREKLAYLTHIDGIPDAMRVIDALRFYATIDKVGDDSVNRVLDLLELQDLKLKYFNQLSQGQKKRVSIARIFLREKQIYLLDEPTANLDPKIAREIRELVLNLSKDKIVLYSSHNLFEAREIGSRVVAISKGKLALFGKIDEIKTQQYVVGIRVFGGENLPASARKEGDYFLFELQGPDEVPKVIGELIAKGVKIREVKEMQNPLEELFK